MGPRGRGAAGPWGPWGRGAVGPWGRGGLGHPGSRAREHPHPPMAESLVEVDMANEFVFRRNISSAGGNVALELLKAIRD